MSNANWEAGGQYLRRGNHPRCGARIRLEREESARLEQSRRAAVSRGVYRPAEDRGRPRPYRSGTAA